MLKLLPLTTRLMCSQKLALAGTLQGEQVWS